MRLVVEFEHVCDIGPIVIQGDRGYE